MCHVVTLYGFCPAVQHMDAPRAQVSFHTVQALMDAKRELQPAVRRNRAREATTTAYAAFHADGRAGALRLQVLCLCLYFAVALPW